MKTQHTPGPWRIGVRQPNSDKFIYDAYGGEVANCDRLTNFPDENLSNARLIAAAPDLLEALSNLYVRASFQLDKSATHDGIENCKVLGDARAAIQKATGGNQ